MLERTTRRPNCAGTSREALSEELTARLSHPMNLSFNPVSKTKE